MTLNKFYSIDECNDDEKLFERLDELQDENKIEWEKQDKWSIKIKDLDLSTKEEEDLIKFLESLDVFPTDGEDEEEDDYYYDGEEESDYKPRKKGYDDDFNNDF